MGGDGVDLEAIAEGLWLRLRDVILAERRLERFTFVPETPEVGAAQPLAALATDSRARAEMARDVVLRALAAASDGVNFRILSSLGAEAPLDEVARRVRLPPLALGERLNALAQVGLAARNLERQSAVATSAGRGLVMFVEALDGALRDRLSQELPGLLAS